MWCNICAGMSTTELMTLIILEFVLIESGYSCDHVMTLAECERAARALGMSDTLAEDDTEYTGGGWGSDPPYCYFWVPSADPTEAGILKFNPGGTNTGACFWYDKCLCYNTPGSAPNLELALAPESNPAPGTTNIP